jgi:hypothetical protein
MSPSHSCCFHFSMVTSSWARRPPLPAGGCVSMSIRSVLICTRQKAPDLSYSASIFLSCFHWKEFLELERCPSPPSSGEELSPSPHLSPRPVLSGPLTVEIFNPPASRRATLSHGLARCPPASRRATLSHGLARCQVYLCLVAFDLGRMAEALRHGSSRPVDSPGRMNSSVCWKFAKPCLMPTKWLF